MASDGIADTDATSIGAARRRFALQELIFGTDADGALSLVLMVDGPVDPDRVRDAGRALLERHRVLRTGVRVRADGTLSTWEGVADLPVCRVVDAQPGDRGASAEEWFGRVADDVKSGIGRLDTGPFVTFTVAYWAYDRSAVIITIAHAVTDAISNATLLGEFCACYDGRRLPEPRLDYRDVIVAEQERAGQDAAAVDRDLAYLSGIDAFSSAPYSLRGTAVAARAMLSPAAEAALRDIARTGETTPFAVLLAVASERLAALSQRAEVLVGVAVDRREQLDVPGAVGPCLDLAVFRIPVGRRAGWDRVSGALAAARDRLWDVLDGGSAPYDLLLARLRQERGTDLQRLFDLAVTYTHSALPSLHLAGHTAVLLDVPMTTPGVALTLNIGRFEGRTAVSVASRSGALEAACAWLAQAIGGVLEQRGVRDAPTDLWPEPSAPTGDPVATEHNPVQPEAPLVAARLGEIWTRILRCEVGVDDNIYALGADSLTVARFCVAAGRAGLEINPRDMMRFPSIGQLLRQDAFRQRPVGAAAQPEPVTRFPLSQGQLGMVYATSASERLPIFSATTRVEFHGPFDERRMSRALTALVARHPILRVTYGLHDRTPSQFVAPAGPVATTVRHIDSLPAEAQDAQIDAMTEELNRRRYDPLTQPLVTFTVLVRGTTHFVLLVGFHHSILDGHSEQRLVEDIATAYATGADLPPLRSEFASFVAAERRVLGNAAHLDFWRGEVERIRAANTGGRDIPRQPSAGQPVRSWTIPAEEAAALRAKAHAAGCPLKSLLLAVHGRALGALLEREEVVTGLSAHNRMPEPDSDLVLGNFINMVPLRIALRGDPTAQIRTAHQRETALVDHGRLPLAAIQRIDGGGRLFWNSFSFTRFRRTPHLVVGDLRVESVVSSVLSDDPLHVNFNEPGEGGPVTVRVRLGPQCPTDAEVTTFCELLARETAGFLG